jgi:biopolymer transport protein ExbB/TolQ
MFLHADQIVKGVMIGLAVASLVTWTVWVAKSIELFGARAAVRRGLRVLAQSTTLAQAREKLKSGTGPVAQLIQAAAAEALLATALGLVAAIPAVMIYNVLARSTAHYRALIGDASALIMNLVSRDLDGGVACIRPRNSRFSESISVAQVE